MSTATRLGLISDYLRGLAEQPPVTPDEHKAAAATLLRYAAAEATKLYGHERQIAVRVSALTQIATTHTRLATHTGPVSNGPH
mgnify:CR=1 FL=1